ncbi:MAG: PTS IIA-like nitrogen regulatory protein PtsN [Casimicrobiaceae bacterium]|nr:PTS IIA-like nitrogen regulatory protein PtsN [Casimicrobiaceae bacterium]MCX8097462.1 PTS IIA-like nitrogen regulatory protein PtsN [Casimicrobiaceae bacterium]MDW8311180.1 PTS IIA-like nitrogen regulatory protein PtsN [Burkholderiales bacterium]
MSLLAELLTPESVLLNVEASNKRRLFEIVALAAEAQFNLSPMATVESLLAREKLGSTGLGQGIAIPHGRIRGLTRAIGFFVRPKEPIVFEAPDRQPVRDVFVLLVPEAATDEHLQILSELAQKFSSKAFREALAKADSGASVYALFCAP